MSRGKRCLVAVVLALCASALSAPFAHAAPSNDHFADRELLAGPLPIAAPGSNLGATKEVGEPSYGFDEPAGRSVWFSWKAGDTEWVTIGTCGSSFGSLVDVYTGGSLATLARVSQWKEGPREDCAPVGSQVTFRALEDTVYAIRVDGNLSPQAPPITEGAFSLEVAPTPVPANDAFAAARTVTAESLEGGTFFRVDVSGFNWNATPESGEPVHPGGPGGASVWYSWTAPATGDAQVKVTAGTLVPLIGVYTGNSVDALAPAPTTPLFPPEVSVPVSAGTTYRFAVDGLFDPLMGLPSMGRFTFLVYLNAPATGNVTSDQAVTPATDRTPPETTIVRRSIRPGKRSATLSFGSSESSGTFLCKLDGRRVAKCGSPSAYTKLAPGSHTFRVRAVDASGNADPTPAITRFAIAHQQRRHR